MADVPVIIEQRVYRLGLATLWTTEDPILLKGELGYESDTKTHKVGDGSTIWSLLPYENGRMAQYTTANLPTPSVINKGIEVYDLTLTVPLYSTGTNWKKVSDNSIVV